MDTEVLAKKLSKRDATIANLADLDRTIADHRTALRQEVEARDASDRDSLPRVRAFREAVEAYVAPAYATLHASQAAINSAPGRVEQARAELVAALRDAERGLEIRLAGLRDEYGAKLDEKRARAVAELDTLDRELRAIREEARGLLEALTAATESP